MQLGSETFDTYARNLRRLYWMEFIDHQMRLQRNERFRASLVFPPRQIDKGASAVPVGAAG